MPFGMAGPRLPLLCEGAIRPPEPGPDQATARAGVVVGMGPVGKIDHRSPAAAIAERPRLHVNDPLAHPRPDLAVPPPRGPFVRSAPWPALVCPWVGLPGGV